MAKSEQASNQSSVVKSANTSRNSIKNSRNTTPSTLRDEMPETDSKRSGGRGSSLKSTAEKSPRRSEAAAGISPDGLLSSIKKSGNKRVSFDDSTHLRESVNDALENRMDFDNDMPVEDPLSPGIATGHSFASSASSKLSQLLGDKSNASSARSPGSANSNKSYRQENSWDEDRDQEEETSKSNDRSTISGRSSTSSAGNNTSVPLATPVVPKKGRGRPPTSSKNSEKSFSMSTPGSEEFTRGHRVEDQTFIATDEDNDDEIDTKNASKEQKEKGKKGKKASTNQNDSSASMLETTTEDVSTSFIDNSFLQTISSTNKKYISGREALQDAKPIRPVVSSKRPPAKKRGMISDEDEESISEGSDDGNVRRSRRATKGRRFAFWKNERPLYQEGTLVGLAAAEPTPVKHTSKSRSNRNANGKPAKKKEKRATGTKRVRNAESDSSLDEDQLMNSKRHRSAPDYNQEIVNEPLNEALLPTDVEYIDPVLTDSMAVWDDYYDRPTTAAVICCKDTCTAPMALPVTSTNRPAGKKVPQPLASHFFHVAEAEKGVMSGWMAGSVDLPPGSIKDAEGVGRYLQVFFVVKGQKGSVEFGLADPLQDFWDDRTAQRVLLGPGDSFYVPPGNIYRLENHSPTISCSINWMIVYPVEYSGEDALQNAPGSSASGATVVSGVSAR